MDRDIIGSPEPVHDLSPCAISSVGSLLYSSSGRAQVHALSLAGAARCSKLATFSPMQVNCWSSAFRKDSSVRITQRCMDATVCGQWCGYEGTHHLHSGMIWSHGSHRIQKRSDKLGNTHEPTQAAMIIASRRQWQEPMRRQRYQMICCNAGEHSHDHLYLQVTSLALVGLGTMPYTKETA